MPHEPEYRKHRTARRYVVELDLNAERAGCTATVVALGCEICADGSLVFYDHYGLKRAYRAGLWLQVWRGANHG